MFTHSQSLGQPSISRDVSVGLRPVGVLRKLLIHLWRIYLWTHQAPRMVSVLSGVPIRTGSFAEEPSQVALFSTVGVAERPGETPTSMGSDTPGLGTHTPGAQGGKAEGTGEERQDS